MQTVKAHEVEHGGDSRRAVAPPQSRVSKIIKTLLWVTVGGVVILLITELVLSFK